MVPCKKTSTFITFLFPLFYMPLKMEIIISKYTIISPVAPMPKNSASEVSSMEKSKSSKIPINCRLFCIGKYLFKNGSKKIVLRQSPVNIRIFNDNFGNFKILKKIQNAKNPVKSRDFGPSKITGFQNVASTRWKK